MKTVCVFCGSSTGTRAAYGDAARCMARELVKRDLRVVYGGGSVGLMGILADAVLDAGGEIIGVLPRHLRDREVGHTRLSELRIVDGMHERKALMTELSDGFITLPGGIGTLEETFEAWTWAQLGIHGKPLGILDVEQFFRPLAAFLDRMVDERFLRPIHRQMVIVDDDPGALLDRMATYVPPDVPKWLNRTET